MGSANARDRQLAKGFVYRIPSYLVVERRKDDVFRQRTVESGEMTHHTAPAGQHQPFFRRMAAQKIISLAEGRDRHFDVDALACPVGHLVFPKVDVGHRGVCLQQLRRRVSRMSRAVRESGSIRSTRCV